MIGLSVVSVKDLIESKADKEKLLSSWKDYSSFKKKIMNPNNFYKKIKLFLVF